MISLYLKCSIVIKKYDLKQMYKFTHTKKKLWIYEAHKCAANTFIVGRYSLTLYSNILNGAELQRQITEANICVFFVK